LTRPRSALFAPTTQDGYAAELQTLLQLGRRAAQHAPTHRAQFLAWMDAVEQSLRHIAADVLSLETALEEAARDLRILCLRAAHLAADRSLRSPLAAEDCRRPDGRRIEFGYERDLDPALLERRIAGLQPTTWPGDHLAFSSGQAAMSAVALAAREVLPQAKDGPLRVRHTGGYFETRALFEIFARCGLYHYSQVEDDAANAAPDLLVFEPVYYDGIGRLKIADVALLARRLRAAEKPLIVIVDATLIGLEFPLNGFLAGLAGYGGPIVLLRSGLKLDQAGLELANVGTVAVHCRSGITPSVEELGSALRNIRTLTGSGLSFDANNALSFPWCLEPQTTNAHCARIFANNARLAATLQDSARFPVVAHPQLEAQLDLDPPRWAQAPFCILRLGDGATEDDYQEIAVRIQAEAENRRLRFDRGGSFGFRGHRFDVVVPEDGTPPFLRIAMGARGGAGRDGVIELLRQL
jgi:hypothetical protein